MAKKLVSHATKAPADVPNSAQLREQKEKEPAAFRCCALDKTRQPNPLTNISGNKKASPSKGTWEAAVALRLISPISTLTLCKTGDKSHPAPPFSAPTDNCKGSQVEGALSQSARLSTVGVPLIKFLAYLAKIQLTLPRGKKN